MAKKQSKGKNQPGQKESKTTSTSTRILQIAFVIFSILIVLSMILAATATY